MPTYKTILLYVYLFWSNLIWNNMKVKIQFSKNKHLLPVCCQRSFTASMPLPLFNALIERLNFPPPSPLLFLLKSEFEAPSWDSISVLRVLVVEILWGWFMARVRVVTFLDFITAWVSSAITLKAAKSQKVFQIKPNFHYRVIQLDLPQIKCLLNHQICNFKS